MSTTSTTLLMELPWAPYRLSVDQYEAMVESGKDPPNATSCS